MLQSPELLELPELQVMSMQQMAQALGRVFGPMVLSSL